MLNGQTNLASQSQSAAKGAKLIPRQYLVPFVLVTALFFLWGIPNNLNDVLIRQFMKSFEISRFKAGLVQSAFYFGYFTLSMPAALVMRRFGYKIGLIAGLLLYGSGTLLFWPAALTQSYSFFLCALFVIAGGLAFLETGSSPFITQIGDPASTERRLNFSQAFNPLGSICGVLVGTTFIFSGVELTSSQIAAQKIAGTYNTFLQHETMRVVTPYLVLGILVFFWAFLLARTTFPQVGEEINPAPTAQPSRFTNLLKRPHFIQAVIAQFFYVGAQVGTWSYFIQYVQDYAHQTEKVAGYFLTGTLLAFAIGRFAASYFMRFIQPNLLMGFFCLINMLLVLVAVVFPGWLGVWAIFATSFFMSLMFPTIFALGLRGLGADTKLGGSLIVMAIIGGAIFTPLMGLVSEATLSMAKAMLVPLSCYLYIACFAFFGSHAPSASVDN